MDKITKITSEAIDRLFNALGNFGYMQYKNVYRILALILIEEMLTTEFLWFLTDEDYNIMTKALNCLADQSCLIDIPSCYDLKIEKSDTLEVFGIRKTQNDYIRVIEDIIRVIV